MLSSVLKLAACSLLLSLSTSAFASEQPWRDTPVNRLAALAIMQTLNADLLSHDSATLTLERWCADHNLADPAEITAERVKDEKAAPDTVREQLKVSSSDKLGYRHVRLKCGEVMLSEADNWYVPNRLTAEMNETLDRTDTPFGKVVLSLHFQRHTVSAELLWQPLPQDWTRIDGLPQTTTENEPLQIPDTILRHQALLSKPDGTPISFVVENYKSNLLRFPSPNLSH